MNLLTYFFIAFIISFLGSLPIGLITLTIVQKTIENGKQSGILISLGATVMEFVYTFIAIISLDFFTKNTIVGNYIKIIATIIFFGMGIQFLIKKNNTHTTTTLEYNYFDFLRGVIVGTMNLLIVPFWIFIGIWLKSNGINFENNTIILVFSIGSALGALLAFIAYIGGSEYIVTKNDKINQYTNKAVGVLFLGLGFFQLIQFL